MPSPAKAESRCSMVEMRTSPLVRVVDSRVSPTLVGVALISTGGIRSVRRNTMPVSGAAGRRAM